jgi:mono/diheme cytochrome c family protein
MSAMRNLPVALVLLLAAVGLGCTAESEEAPLQPSYEHDIKPLMAAHCTRCHGAGGTLNLDPDSKPTLNQQKPVNGDFTRLDNVGSVEGLMAYTGPAGSGARRMRTYLAIPMPPPPSAPLSDRELEMLNTWIDNPLP